ncbi:putative methyltransferase-domain-containing protein [Amanita rubescens]|nr:putative methyltransferase-domain-containing protein [Amanita rubescens]
MHVADDVIEDTLPSKDYLSVLPRQSHSIKDEILSLTFQCNGKDQNPISISLFMDASPGCGGIAWPAGQILSNYIVKRGLLQGKTILELGSGTGLVGLVAGKLGAKVWITDQAPLLGIMRKNVKMNHLESCVTVAELNWGVDPPPDIPRPDVILAADCVYFEPAFPLLAQTLADLADQSTEVLFCYKKRRKADKRFFAFLKKYFSWEDVNDDPNRAIYNREAISLLRLHRTSCAR